MSMIKCDRRELKVFDGEICVLAEGEGKINGTHLTKGPGALLQRYYTFHYRIIISGHAK